MQVMNPMAQINQHHNQFGFAQGQHNQFGHQSPPCHQKINQFPPQFSNFQGNQGYGQINRCMMNGGMFQYGMMNQMGFQNPNQMGFNQFNGFGQHNQFIPPSHQNQFNMQMNRNRFNSRNDAPSEVIEIDCSSSKSDAESIRGRVRERTSQ
jgi:hypothetical protein